MNKLMNKSLALFLSALLSVCCVPVLAFADNLSSENGAEWNIDGGTLTISASGDSGENNKLALGEGQENWPWLSQASDITSVVISNQVIAGASLANLFDGCSNLTNVTGLSYINTNATTDMSNMFNGCEKLTQLDVTGWNTSNVNEYANMFPPSLNYITFGSGFTLLNALPDGTWRDLYNSSNEFTVSSGSASSSSVSAGTYYKSVTGLSFNPNELTFNLSESEAQQSTTVSVSPVDAYIPQNPPITWSMTNSTDCVEIATSPFENGSQTCTVTPKSNGTYTITASCTGVENATCEVTVTGGSVPVMEVTLNETSKTITVGGTFTLTATVQPNDATDKSVTWSSGNTSVATVDDDGVVTAVAPGEATITATSKSNNEKTAICTVTVTEARIPATGITLPSTESVVVGSTVTLAPTLEPSNTTDSVTWASSDEGVATVSNGVVTGVSAGTADITATCNDKTATCTVTVTGGIVPVTEVTLDVGSKTITVGGTFTLTATVQPNDATDKSVTWSSGNTSVATVDDDGVVTAVAPGEATITATSKSNNEKTAICTVTVTASVTPTIAVTGITLDETTKTMTKGETFPLTATVQPNDATDKSVTWSSNNTSVATVSNGVVTAVAPGEATITVQSESNKEKTATCEITVPGIVLNETSITLDDNEGTSDIAKTVKLEATVYPTTSTPTIAWDSSNKAVATVAEDGTVTAVAPGTSTITATIGEGDAAMSASCSVTVAGIVLDPTTMTLNAGDAQAITINRYGISTEAQVVWASGNDNIATASKDESQDGNVTYSIKGIGKGGTTVTATCAGYSASCEVTVTDLLSIQIKDLPENWEIVRGTTTSALTATVEWDEGDEPIASNELAWAWTVDPEVAATPNFEGDTPSDTATITANEVVDNATLTITASNGDEPIAKGTFPFTIVRPTVKVVSISIPEGYSDPIQLVGGKDEGVQLSVVTEPQIESMKDVAWKSNPESVATVSDFGYVTPVGKGTATITASSGVGEGETSATCTVVVSNPANKASIQNAPTTAMLVDSSVTLIAALSGPLGDLTDGAKSYAWSSSNDEILKIEGSTTDQSAVVSAVSAGKATISVEVTTADGTELKATVEITVTNQDVSSIELNPTKLEITVGDDPVQIMATVLPVVASPGFDVVWSSSNEEYATVDQSGYVTPVSMGITTITATAKSISGDSSLDKIATCGVTVMPLAMGTDGESEYDGSILIYDQETADFMKPLTLRINDVSREDLGVVMDLAKQAAGPGSSYVDAFEIDLVNSDNQVVPWNGNGSQVGVSIIDPTDDIQELSKDQDLRIFYVDDPATKATEMPTMITETGIFFETSHFSTYALTATPFEIIPITPDPDGNGNGNGNQGVTNTGTGSKDNDILKGLASTGDMILSSSGVPVTLSLLGMTLAMLIIALRRTFIDEE